MSEAAIKLAQEAMVTAEETENNVKLHVEEAMRVSNEALNTSAEIKVSRILDLETMKALQEATEKAENAKSCRRN